MTITKELIEQWLTEYTAAKGLKDCAMHIAQRAASYGAEQREAELMAVGMEPTWEVFEDGLPYPSDGFGPVGEKLYTAEQLAAARLQERKRCSDIVASEASQYSEPGWAVEIINDIESGT